MFPNLYVCFIRVIICLKKKTVDAGLLITIHGDSSASVLSDDNKNEGERKEIND